MKISFSLYSRNSIFSVFNLTINMIMIRLTLYHQWVLHLLLHVTALCQRKKNTFWAEDLKLDQAIFRLNKKMSLAMLPVYCVQCQISTQIWFLHRKFFTLMKILYWREKFFNKKKYSIFLWNRFNSKIVDSRQLIQTTS